MKEVVILSEKPKRYIITTSTELVTEDLKDQVVGLLGTCKHGSSKEIRF